MHKVTNAPTSPKLPGGDVGVVGALPGEARPLHPADPDLVQGVGASRRACWGMVARDSHKDTKEANVPHWVPSHPHLVARPILGGLHQEYQPEKLAS